MEGVETAHDLRSDNRSKYVENTYGNNASNIDMDAPNAQPDSIPIETMPTNTRKRTRVRCTETSTPRQKTLRMGKLRKSISKKITEYSLISGCHSVALFQTRNGSVRVCGTKPLCVLLSSQEINPKLSSAIAEPSNLDPVVLHQRQEETEEDKNKKKSRIADLRDKE